MIENWDRYFYGEPLQIGTQKQLLIDNQIVADRWNVRRVQHAPVKDLRNPMVVRDLPYEDHCYYVTVLRDPQAGVFRMWYGDFDSSAYYGGGRREDTADGRPYKTRYAESRDGIHWHKPMLGLYEFHGSRENNIVCAGRQRCAVGGVVENPDPSQPERKYIMCYLDNPGPGSGVCIAYSPDGLHWTPQADNPVILGHSDCPNNIVWDPQRRIWLLFGRPPVFAAGDRDQEFKKLVTRHHRRRVSVSVSEDLVHWTHPRVALYADELDDVPDFDNFRGFYYEGMFFGAIGLLNHMDRGGGDSLLAFSRDGFSWDRLPDRPYWIRRGREGDFDSVWVHASCPPVRVGDELWFYYGAGRQGNDSHNAELSIGLARLPLDGMIGQYADVRGGYLLTREVEITGKRLVLNIATDYAFHDPIEPAIVGQIKAEFVQAGDAREAVLGGRAIPGFTIEDCDPCMGELKHKVVTWKGNSDISALAGRRAHLRFYLQQGELFSFQFEE
jgi:hypothetical protein